MEIRPRYLQLQVLQDLSRKTVFVAGPRQVGKTTLARALPGGEAEYLNWDLAEHRERILKRELPSSELWAFDEIHKYRSWRNYLKPSTGHRICNLKSSGESACENSHGLSRI